MVPAASKVVAYLLTRGFAARPAAGFPDAIANGPPEQIRVWKRNSADPFAGEFGLASPQSDRVLIQAYGPRGVAAFAPASHAGGPADPIAPAAALAFDALDAATSPDVLMIRAAIVRPALRAPARAANPGNLAQWTPLPAYVALVYAQIFTLGRGGEVKLALPYLTCEAAKRAARIMLDRWAATPSPATGKPAAIYIAATAATEVIRTPAGACAAVMTIRDKPKLARKTFLLPSAITVLWAISADAFAPTLLDHP